MKEVTLSIILFFGLHSAIGQNNLNFTQNECGNSEENTDELKQRIISIIQTKDSTKIIIGVYGICCARYTGNYKITASNASEIKTLHLTYEIAKDNEEICMCHCFYEFTYSIVGLKEDNYSIIVNDKVLPVTDEKYRIERFERDSLPNGTILIRKFVDDIKVLEIERNDTTRLIRKYRNGELYEEKRKVYGKN